jgi:intracellular sulfur oxidation DsrE/DsrF family protein
MTPPKEESGMTYEEYLDEVTTLITEKYNVGDAAAIKLVVKAQAADFFVKHDENEAMRTLDRAHQDARTIYTASQKK